MRRFLCIFGIHNYEAINVYHYNDLSYGSCVPSTSVTLQCICCGNIKNKLVYGGGYIPLEKFNKKG